MHQQPDIVGIEVDRLLASIQAAHAQQQRA
jgi:hypothetical protein